MLNIRDNCYPRVVEPSGERKKMVETYSIQIIMACVDSEPSRLLALVRPWTRLIDELSKRCLCVSPLQMAGGGPKGWLPHVVFQGQPGREWRQRRVSLAHHPGRGDDEPVDEHVEIQVMFPGVCIWAPANEVYETLPVCVLPPQLQRLLFSPMCLFLM